MRRHGPCTERRAAILGCMYSDYRVTWESLCSDGWHHAKDGYKDDLRRRSGAHALPRALSPVP